MSLFVEQFDKPASTRDAMALGAAAQRAGDVLAGRTIWCAIAMPGARRSADALRTRVDGAGPGVAATSLQLTAAEPLRELAGQLEQMLGGVSMPGSSDSDRPSARPTPAAPSTATICSAMASKRTTSSSCTTRSAPSSRRPYASAAHTSCGVFALRAARRLQGNTPCSSCSA